jgi:hypothetical protein
MPACGNTLSVNKKIKRIKWEKLAVGIKNKLF